MHTSLMTQQWRRRGTDTTLLGTLTTANARTHLVHHACAGRLAALCNLAKHAVCLCVRTCLCVCPVRAKASHLASSSCALQVLLRSPSHASAHTQRHAHIAVREAPTHAHLHTCSLAPQGLMR